MASVDEESLLVQQKEAVNILCTRGGDDYAYFLNSSDIIDFLNEEEKQYIVDLNLKEIIYSEDEEKQDECLLYDDETSDPEICTSLETDGPRLIAHGGSKEPETKIVFSPGICKEIIKMIKGSSSSIKIAMFMFTDPAIFKEICGRKLSCPQVSVHILVDETQFKEFMDMAKKLIKKEFDNQEIGINVKDITKRGNPSHGNRSGKAHEKFMIVDESRAVTGSFNFTWASEHINYDQVIISHDKEAIVTPLLKHFKKMSRKAKYQIL